MVSVGVVIPCHNQGDTLQRAVVSALEADVIVVVNDGGNSKTEDIALALERLNDKIVSVATGYPFPSGVCHARNEGISQAGYGELCDLIIPLDADDYLLPGGLEALRDAYEPGTFIYSDYQINGSIITAPPPGMINRKNISHATICYSHEDWYKVGGYDPDFNIGCEDWALTCAFVEAGLRPKHIPVATYYRTENPNGRAARCLKYAPLLLDLLKDKYPKVFTS